MPPLTAAVAGSIQKKLYYVNRSTGQVCHVEKIEHYHGQRLVEFRFNLASQADPARTDSATVFGKLESVFEKEFALLSETGKQVLKNYLIIQISEVPDLSPGGAAALKQSDRELEAICLKCRKDNFYSFEYANHYCHIDPYHLVIQCECGENERECLGCALEEQKLAEMERVLKENAEESAAPAVAPPSVSDVTVDMNKLWSERDNSRFGF